MYWHFLQCYKFDNALGFQTILGSENIFGCQQNLQSLKPRCLKVFKRSLDIANSTENVANVDKVANVGNHDDDSVDNVSILNLLPLIEAISKTFLNHSPIWVQEIILAHLGKPKEMIKNALKAWIQHLISKTSKLFYRFLCYLKVSKFLLPFKCADNPCFRHADEYASASFVQKWNLSRSDVRHLWRASDPVSTFGGFTKYPYNKTSSLSGSVALCEETTSQAWALKRKRRSFGVTVQMWTSTGLLSWIFGSSMMDVQWVVMVSNLDGCLVCNTSMSSFKREDRKF